VKEFHPSKSMFPPLLKEIKLTGRLRGVKPLFQKPSPSPLKERGIKRVR